MKRRRLIVSLPCDVAGCEGEIRRAIKHPKYNTTEEGWKLYQCDTCGDEVLVEQ